MSEEVKNINDLEVVENGSAGGWPSIITEQANYVEIDMNGITTTSTDIVVMLIGRNKF